ncbi:DMT family transporter [Granulosicoccus antarcticus]|uniref:EamA domain-containing protein n=1 Tax=Granulosicoccus antarcticus IMCC3135 TaxID=1192854 RepID=A0A2Z2NUL6_9GAMM|nr:DMT family transporter [Granulosicoccus antarcticus]ASJ71357.1 hypothetical protein IMCC3135_06250 [Granulosicoccus antarcticus IMCC3135]
MPQQSIIAGIAAWLFVLIWATGFVVARGISGLIDPYLFLLARFISVLLIFALAMLILRTPLPTWQDRWRLIGIGALMQGFYLGPGFWAVSQGLEAGIMSLIGALQPPLTAVLAWYFLNEKISRRTITGLLIGVTGVALAISPGLSNTMPSSSISIWVIAASLLSVSAITAGSLLQKSSIVSVPLLSAITFQTLGAAMVMLIMNSMLGHWQFPLTAPALGYLGYAVLVLSIGGFTLLTWLIRSGSATRASSLLLLVPPLAAIISWWLYDEALVSMQIVGFAMALLGVLIARSSPASRKS